jgi:hypothetical protein
MNIALRVPESLGMTLKEFAKKESISMNQFISMAIAEKMSALQTYDYLEERAQKGSIEKMESLLQKVPSREVLYEDDKL